MMENVFYFMLKAFFVLEIFKFFPDFSYHVERRVDNKTQVNLTDWITKNYHPHIVQYLKK